ncbi:gamma-butyrobetaine hydroxylase-like domain-containing protein [Marinobacter subterrani]|uniref:gamma-butyrobetaine hydroxylase-like domain-containing protein n=1 Tax=Marinobacter subterrani TaxID=1658765 RepID=UPI003B5C4030
MGGTLVLKWLGESAVHIPARTLRRHCLCEDCKINKRDLAGHASPDSIANIRPLGLIGLRVRFSDGHDAGTFCWTALRALSM